jgi:2,4-dienoyl-CoA reductase-like NADH-dependent reductase (Old Yellow Enzyme family)
MPGVPGLFTPEQIAGWKRVVDAVHEKGAYIYAQLWHAGRVTIPQMTGSHPVAPSAIPWDSPDERYSHPPVGESVPPRYADHRPIELSVSHIQRTIEDYRRAARTAIDIGFDGVEVHGGNGYLPEQFLSSNINKRTDEYGGTPEKRCRFTLELMDSLAQSIGEENLSIRLSPFGLFNQTRGEQRLETWSHLCRALKQTLPHLSYVSFIEPVRFVPWPNRKKARTDSDKQRYEQIFSAEEKDTFLASWGLADVNLDGFRQIFGSTPFFTAGGYNAILFGRPFTSNPDLVNRLRKGIPLTPYERSRFYGPFEDNKLCYVDYEPAQEA